MFVDRDESGKIVSTFYERQYKDQESLLDDHADLLDFKGLSPTKLEKKRVENLKATARAGLSTAIGDWGDNIADTLRCMVLGRAIVNGTVTDEQVIQRYDNYCTLLLEGYGGPDAIMDVLELDAIAFKQWIVDLYYAGKASTP